ncbi:MAG: response regulator [Lachnospiraceae bacterium]|nr:response regulator [Lachnospiraceae bacterium]
MEKTNSRVLIVDDLSVNRMIMSSLLASRRVISDQAESGYKFLELCQKYDYDLIFMDHRMPEFDGIDTLTALHDLFKKKGRTVPVICHTTEEGKRNINLYKAAGFSDVLIKPIEPGRLSEIISRYLPSYEDNTPEEKIISNEEDAREELDKLPMCLKIVPHIDLLAGISNCGSAEDYVNALSVFHSSIMDKSEEIAGHLRSENWSAFKLDVHSLKSMARLVGARDLGGMAAELEEYAGNSEYSKIRLDTPMLLFEYRRFSSLLSPLDDDEEVKNILREAGEKKKGPDANRRKDNSRSVLFIQSTQGIFTKGIEKSLIDKGYKVISVPDSPDLIINHRFDADIVIYFPEFHDDSHIGVTMSLLGEVCQDDSKVLVLTGDSNDIEVAMKSRGSYRVSRSYPRPVDINSFTNDMEYFSSLLVEHNRTKTVYLVDDDENYLSVISSRLSPYMNVSCFSDAKGVLEGMSAVVPDLIIMDYEMPGMNGLELMKSIRQEPETSTIPIIFLTGQNEKDQVYSILQYRPDGYLLKSSSRDTIIDSINRFFDESFFRMTL